MRNILALLILFSSFSLWAQKGNHLETIYFRNPQYVLSMDKVIYPGYQLKFENIVLHEYLKNKKISATPLKMPPRLITFRDSEGKEIYWEKSKNYPSFERYIALVSSSVSYMDSSSVDFDAELFEQVKIAWNKADWDGKLYYDEKPSDFEIQISRYDNDLEYEYVHYPAELPGFEFEYSARLDDDYNIIKERCSVYFMENDNDVILTQLTPVKANNFADSLLNGYKKTDVRLKPIFDKKGRQIGTDGDAKYVDVIERGYFDLYTNQILPPEVDGEVFFPYRNSSIFTLINEFAEEYTIIKTTQSFQDAFENPTKLEIIDGAGDRISLQDFFDYGQETQSLFEEQKSQLESAWNFSKVGKELTITSLDYEYYQTNLPLVEYVSDSRSLKENEVFDASGNVYETTKIGERIWMKENLRSEHFQDGSEIPNLTTSQWATSTKEGIIINEDMDVTLANKGHRYNGYTIVSEKNVCPYGFWVPDADDIAELYNDVTPYSEYVKIKGNKVKAKRYSSIFYPIVLPVATALNVGWNSIALGADATLLAGAGAIDLTYNTPWFLADLFLLGPILGWEKVIDKTYAKQMKYYKNIQLDSSPYNKPVNIPVNEDGYILKYDYSDDLFLDENGNSIRIQEEDYDNCEMYIEVTDEFGYESLEPTDKPKYKSEWKNPNPNSGVLYNPLPTFKGNGGFHLFRGSFDLLDDVSGLFHYFRSAPYQPISIYNFYQQFEQKSRAFPVKSSMRHMPVLAQLLKKDETFKDNYDFGLSESNSVRFIKKQEPRNLKIRSNIGITYKHWGVPNMWGVYKKLDSHELIAAPSIELGDDFKLLKMSTEIRCVNDPFYEAPEDNY